VAAITKDPFGPLIKDGDTVPLVDRDDGIGAIERRLVRNSLERSSVSTVADLCVS
jgi:hypothetical protein